MYMYTCYHVKLLTNMYNIIICTHIKVQFIHEYVYTHHLVKLILVSYPCLRLPYVCDVFG